MSGTGSLNGARIAVLNWRDPWQRSAGGSEQYAYEMSLALVRAGAVVHFLTAREPGQRRREERDGVTWLRSGGRWSVYPRVLLRLLWRRLTGAGYDVVLDCQNGIPFFAPCVVSRRTPVVLLVHHVHDVQFGIHFPGPVAALGRWLEGPASRRVYRRSPAVAVSPSTVAAMRGRLRWRGPIELIPNGITGADELFGGDRARSPAPRVVAVGRLVRHKRVDQVARLADELAAEWPGLEVHIVGTGPDEPAVRTAASRLEHGARVVVHGHLPAPERNELLRSAWVHVCASHGEGWGLCVVEAAACGVPTVAYDVDGLRDAVRDGRTGWLVGAGETLAAAVSRALRELESDPARAAEVGAECRDWAGRFDWKRSGDQMTEFVGQVLFRQVLLRRVFFRAGAGRWRSWR